MHLVWLARPSCLWDGLANWTSHHVIEPQMHSSVLQHYKGVHKEGHRGHSSPLLYIRGRWEGAKGNPCYILTPLGILSSLTSFAPIARFAPFLETLNLPRSLKKFLNTAPIIYNYMQLTPMQCDLVSLKRHTR